MILDSDFTLYLKEENKPQPYFALKVDNTDILVIAEKPSVAKSIAKVLGADKNEDGYLEGNGYVVSWCVGHLIELAQPESYDAAYHKWNYETLPIIPDVFQYQVKNDTKKQYKGKRNMDR